jgi:hypothetical protein
VAAKCKNASISSCASSAAAEAPASLDMALVLSMCKINFLFYIDAILAALHALPIGALLAWSARQAHQGIRSTLTLHRWECNARTIKVTRQLGVDNAKSYWDLLQSGWPSTALPRCYDWAAPSRTSCWLVCRSGTHVTLVETSSRDALGA